MILRSDNGFKCVCTKQQSLKYMKENDRAKRKNRQINNYHWEIQHDLLN